jgi:hypothetical protein
MNHEPSEAAAAPPEEVPAIPIRPASGVASPPKAQLAPGGECLRPFINEQLNSRLPVRLPRAEWMLRWQAGLDPSVTPAFVLQASDRIVVQGAGSWQLFDLNRNSIFAGSLGPSAITLDPANSVLYFADTYGVITAFRLADGAEAYALPGSRGVEWYREFFSRRGQEFAAVSFMMLLQPHAPTEPNSVIVEDLDLGNPVTVEDGAITSGRRLGRFYFAAPRAYAAGFGPGIVVAIRNEFIITEFGRKIRGRYSDTFDAGPISLDETARTYALVRRNEKTSLWCLTARGERVFAVEFAPDWPVKPLPPVIGYDHRVYLTTGDSVVCVSPEGKILWRQAAGGPVAGMAVTPDDELIAAAGSALVSFGLDGTRHVLYDFKGDTLVTPPASVKGGGLLVASAKKLYRLEGR